MKELFFWIIASGIFLLLFVAVLLTGIVKKNKRILLASIAVFILAGSVAAYTGYLFLSKSWNHLSEMTAPRTGSEIYTALFGDSPYTCVKVLNHQDQVIPKIDYAIWLEVETCPQEMARILSTKPFSRKIVSTAGMNSQQPSANNYWFKPETMGDSILVFEKVDMYGNGQIFYCNEDSTKVYCQDILD